jgi:hypothetical protein
VPQSLLAFDTDHIKRYVFGTNKLKEIRGASSLLDSLNRVSTVRKAESAPFHARTIYAHGGSALFLLDSDQAKPLGKAIQKLYREESGGASITYAIQPLPDYGTQEIMTARQLNEEVTMAQILKLLRLRLNLAKDSPQQSQTAQNSAQDELGAAVLALPSYMLLSLCQSCGVEYATGTWRDLDDPDEPEGLYCQTCLKKRDEDKRIKEMLYRSSVEALRAETLWGRILQTLAQPGYPENQPYALPARIRRPKDFDAFREFLGGKDYLGLIYADANGMGRAMDEMETLDEVKTFAEKVDGAVFHAMADAIRSHLPARQETLPFDILLVGGDDIVMVTPAAQALHVAANLAERFQFHTGEQHTLSVGVVFAPLKYPFNLQRMLADETLKAAKKAGAANKVDGSGEPEQSSLNFVVVMGNTSLNYTKIVEQLHQRKPTQEEFYATLRPYSLSEFQQLLKQLQKGKEKRLGRTRLHHLREAILKIDRSTSASILEALALLRNWKDLDQRDFLKDLVKRYDKRLTPQQEQKGTLFPWALDGERSQKGWFTYCTPLLDFIELYDFLP